jgi:hypothetical protein
MRLILSIVDQLHPLKTIRYPSESESQPIIGRFSSWLLDTVARLFSLPVPDNVKLVILLVLLQRCMKTPDPLELDDSIVNTLVQSPEAVAWDDALRAYAKMARASFQPTKLYRHYL